MTSTKNRIRETLALRYEELQEDLRLELMENVVKILLSYESLTTAQTEIENLWSGVHTEQILRNRGISTKGVKSSS